MCLVDELFPVPKILCKCSLFQDCEIVTGPFKPGTKTDMQSMFPPLIVHLLLLCNWGLIFHSCDLTFSSLAKV